MPKQRLTLDLSVEQEDGALKLRVDTIREHMPWYKRPFVRKQMLKRVGYGIVLPMRVTSATRAQIAQPELLRVLQHTRKLEVRAENPREVRV